MPAIGRRRLALFPVLCLLALLQNGSYLLCEVTIVARSLERLLGFQGSQSARFDVQPLRQILAQELADFSIKCLRILGRFLCDFPNPLQAVVNPALAHAPADDFRGRLYRDERRAITERLPGTRQIPLPINPKTNAPIAKLRSTGWICLNSLKLGLASGQACSSRQFSALESE